MIYLRCINMFSRRRIVHVQNAIPRSRCMPKMACATSLAGDSGDPTATRRVGASTLTLQCAFCFFAAFCFFRLLIGLNFLQKSLSTHYCDFS